VKNNNDRHTAHHSHTTKAAEAAVANIGITRCQTFPSYLSNILCSRTKDNCLLFAAVSTDKDGKWHSCSSAQDHPVSDGGLLGLILPLWWG
jgi:hypothetical protein